MTLHHLDDKMIRELTLPFEFETLSLKGNVEVYIYPRSKRALTFGGKKLEPYMYVCTSLDLWGDVNGEYTVGQIRQDVFNFHPGDYSQEELTIRDIDMVDL